MRDHHAEWMKVYCAENSEKLSARSAQWREDNRERYNAYMRAYQKRKRIERKQQLEK